MDTRGTKILVSILLCLLSATCGFAVSQIAVVGDVKGHTIEIRDLKESVLNLHQELTAIIGENRELINLVRVQNEILKEKQKQ